MQVLFPPKIARPTSADLRFLREVDIKVRTLSKETYTIPKSKVEYRQENFHDVRLTNSELERMLGLVGLKKGIVLRPANINWGLNVGFEVGHVTPPVNLKDAKGTYDLLVRFQEKQLPEGYLFDNLAETFMQSENIKMITSCSLAAPVNQRDLYDY